MLTGSRQRISRKVHLNYVLLLSRAKDNPDKEHDGKQIGSRTWHKVHSLSTFIIYKKSFFQDNFFLWLEHGIFKTY